jgi:hypothetical protein
MLLILRMPYAACAFTAALGVAHRILFHSFNTLHPDPLILAEVPASAAMHK